ncbi:MAG: hypothetical protein IJX03_02690 [Clostridia bacterium]|nr:hypothetical protein [Clostridia bacterium]
MKKKIIAIIIAAVLLIGGVITIVACTTNDKPKTETNVAIGDNSFMTGTETYAMPKAMSFSARALAASETGSVSVNVSARVLPESAPNRQVDWSVAWADPSNTSIVAAYITVTPTSDGSTEAVITCYQEFEGEIIITVTTREGKLSDSCVVTFVGKPSEIAIAGSGLSNGTGSFGSYINLGSGNTYNFTIIPSNVFGKVGADCNYTYSIRGVGSIVTKDNTVNTSTDAVTWLDGTEQTINLNDITTVSPWYSSMFNISINGDVLSIKPNCTPENYITSQTRVSTSKIENDNEFFKFTDDNWYYEITVTETNTGISNSIKVRPIKSVTSVSLSLSEYVF